MSFLNYFSQSQFMINRDVYRDFLSCVLEYTQSSVGYLHLYDETTQELTINIWSDDFSVSEKYISITKVNLNNTGNWTEAIKTRQAVVQSDHNAEQLLSLPKKLSNSTQQHHVSFPIKHQNKIVALLGLFNPKIKFSQIKLKELEHKLNQGWLVLIQKLTEVNNFHNFLNSSYNVNGEKNKQPNLRNMSELVLSMVETISRTMALRDKYTAFHQRNVAFITVEIAKKLQLSAQVIYGLYLGSLIHDIGKISIPAEILSKQGIISPEEYNLLKCHAKNGGQIIDDVMTPWPIKTMILQHHERIDGSGYPLGLKDKEICLEAKIIAVADTYDAMASDRPYRKALGVKKAHETILQGKKRLFDEKVVDIFNQCYQQDETFGGRYKV